MLFYTVVLYSLVPQLLMALIHTILDPRVKQIEFFINVFAMIDLHYPPPRIEPDMQRYETMLAEAGASTWYFSWVAMLEAIAKTLD